VRALLFNGVLVAATSLIILWQVPTAQLNLRVGDVSPRDVVAPRRITYVSVSETEEARSRAEVSVRDVYDPPDARVARQQVTRARQILDYIANVRADPYGTPLDKAAWIQAIPDINLTGQVISQILALDDKSWRRVEEETLYVLDQALRSEIRQNQVIQTQERLPSLVRLDLSEDQAAITTALASNLIVPNTFVNKSKTDEARQEARNSVEPQEITLEQGQTILRAGDIVQAWQLEALDALGLRRPEVGWRTAVGTMALMGLLAVMLGLFLLRFRPDLWRQPRYLSLILFLIVLFTLLARFMVPSHTVLPYLLPLAALTMMVTMFIDAQVAIAIAILMGFIVGVLSDNSLELAAYATISGVVAALNLRKAERVNTFLRNGAYVSLTSMVIILAFRMPGYNYDLIGLVTLLVVATLNGAVSAGLTLVGFFIIGNLFDITTSLQLLELARPDQPLLRQLLLKAPGTYHHSLMVSNMAEQAAERIGANALLARVGAYYHDIGKSLRPYFFVENTAEGVNVHDRLDPHTSAQLIVGHVKDGLELARKYRLPRQVRAFIPEHQGTSLVKSFYHQARQEAEDPDEVNEADFRYLGPRPQSRETAIVMLADTCEARVRANRPKSVAEIEEIVRQSIIDKILEGELDESDLTMHDLYQIRVAFVGVLQGVFHPRLRYPEDARLAEEELAPQIASAVSPAPPGSNGT
jgi:putative nucleotidyltransferase with HDIG domain